MGIGNAEPDTCVTPGASADEVFGALLRHCLPRLRECADAVPGGDEEAVHQMRVALRKTRTLFSLFASVLGDDPVAGRLKEEFRWISAKLGALRDLDLFLSEAMGSAKGEATATPQLDPLRYVIEEQRRRARSRAEAALGSVRFRTLLRRAGAWEERRPHATAHAEGRRLGGRPIESFAAEELARRWRKLKKSGAHLRKLEPEKRHRVRIRAKKLRFAVEFLGEAFHGAAAKKRRRRLLSELKQIQDCLGGLNDVAIRQKLASETASNAGKSSFAAGFVAGREAARADDLLRSAGDSISRLKKLKPFWT